MEAVFLPGWGAPASLYAPLLPSRWTALDPPAFAAAGGTLGAYRTWLAGELSMRGRSVVGGHSMGGALALLAAAADPGRVERLVLISPAGLPIDKPIHRSAVDFARQLLGGLYPLREAATGAVRFVRAPRAALRVAHELRSLDLRRECARLRTHRVPALVVGCTSDSLVRAESSYRLAAALGADYLELELAGGHMWMLRDGRLFGDVLSRQQL